MSVEKELLKIKRRLRYFDRFSVLIEIERFLSEHPEHSVERFQRLPFLSFLVVEWLFEVTPNKSTRVATKRDVYWFVNRLFELNGKTTAGNNSDSLILFMRPLINNQFWIQHRNEYWLRALINQFEIFHPDNTSPFDNEFKQATGIKLTDFFVIVSYVYFGMRAENRRLNYIQIVKYLHPYYSLETIAKSIRIIAGTPTQLQDFLCNTFPREVTDTVTIAETRLLHKPILITEGYLYCADVTLLGRGIAEAALNHFVRKNTAGFRKRFGLAFEHYVNVCLSRPDISYLRETDVEAIYKGAGISGKVTDFLVTGDDGCVFVEAKGVVPRAETLCTANPYLIKRQLKDSIIKGIKQIVECAYLLDGASNQFSAVKKERFGLIVTQGEFLLKCGIDIAQDIAPHEIKSLTKKFGEPIPYNNIFVCSIQDFEYLTGIAKQQPDFLLAFLRHCCREDADPITMKMMMVQHIETFFKVLIPGDEEYTRLESRGLKDNRLFDKTIDVMSDCHAYWKGKLISTTYDKSISLQRMLQAT